MAAPVNRSQLQKQPSVDHEDSEHEFPPQTVESCQENNTDLNSLVVDQNMTVGDEDISHKENKINHEELLIESTTETENAIKYNCDFPVSGEVDICNIQIDDTHSQLVQEYRALKIKVDGMYDKNEHEPVLDDNKEDMLSFVVRILSIPQSDKLSPDRQHLLECNGFLEKALLANPSVIALSSICRKCDTAEVKEISGDDGESAASTKKVSVEWTNDEPRARMIMHKLCAFYGLHHNIVGQQLTTTIRVEFDTSSFVEWKCSLVELSRFLELKRMLGMDSEEVSSPNIGVLQGAEAKTILKRNPSHGSQSGMCGYVSGESRVNKTYEDRHTRYYQRRRELGLYSNEQQATIVCTKKNQRGVRQMHSMPTHDTSSREQLARTRLDAQPRSRTTDLEGTSYIMADGTMIKPDAFLQPDLLSVHNGSAAIMGSASDASSPSEAMSSVIGYPITESTVVYKLIPTELKACNPDENIYVLRQGCLDPTLLRTPDGKPFRNAPSECFPVSGTIVIPNCMTTSLSASLSDCHLNKAGTTSPGQSSGSSSQFQTSQLSCGNSNNSNLSVSGNSGSRGRCGSNQYNRSNSVPHGRSGQLRHALTPPPIHPASTHSLQQGIAPPVGMIQINTSGASQTNTFAGQYATPLLQPLPMTTRHMSGVTPTVYPQASATPPNISQQQHMGTNQHAQYFPNFQQFPGPQITHIGESPYSTAQQVCPSQSSPLLPGQSPAQAAYLSPGVLPLPYQTVMVSPSFMISHQLASPVQPQRLLQSPQFSGQVPIAASNQTFNIHNQLPQPPSLVHPFNPIGTMHQIRQQNNNGNISYQQNRAPNAPRLARPNGRQSFSGGANSNASGRGGESH